VLKQLDVLEGAGNAQTRNLVGRLIRKNLPVQKVPGTVIPLMKEQDLPAISC
jgi:hypothetical protein